MCNLIGRTVVALILFTLSLHAVPADTKSAMAEAAAANRFLFLIFYDKDDASLKNMASTVAAFRKTTPIKCAIYNALISDPKNTELAAQYGISAANLPFVLTVAPNGALTGGTPKTVTAEQLKQSVSITGLTLKVMKPLQEQKVVLAVLRNGTTQFNSEALQGVNDFTKEYSKFVSAIEADPTAPENEDFMKQCQLVSPLTQATVVVLMPPGRIARVLSGKVTKAEILAVLQACSPASCGPSSCKPGACSDRRFKKNITPIVSALDKIDRLIGVTFTWDRSSFPERFFPKGTEVGLIAQDVETVVPEVVRTDPEGYKSITYDKLTAVLIEAVKELNRKVEAQDSLLQVQNMRIRELEGRKP